MAGKLIELKEAARLLGISPEDLAELRSSGKIFGYRDGATWKFKEEEIERVAAERAGPATDDVLDDLDELVQVDSSDEGSSILVSEEELGLSPEGMGSTIIGQDKSPAAAESDIRLASDSSLSPASGTGSSSRISLAGESGAGSRAAFGTSDVLSDGSAKHPLPPKAGKPSLDDDLSLELSPGDELSLGEGALGNLSLGTGSSAKGSLSDLSLDEVSPNDGLLGDLSLGDDLTSGAGSSDADLILSGGKGDSGKSSPSGSAIDLDDDDALVLGTGSGTAVGKGSGKGSDVASAPSDSGINLMSPSQSGLSLEQPVEISPGASAIDSFELGEDSDQILLESDATDPDAATQLRADDEFLLTPVEGGEGLDDADSGSQVIALDETGEIDQEAHTMLAPVAGGALLEEEPVGFQGAAAAPASAAMLAPQPVEIPYNIWNVLSLFMVSVMMVLVGIMMTDLMRNMWSWDETFTASSHLMDWVIATFGAK